jgi:cytosine/adenosine deaminase-related metal-dependent hydrolase
VSDDTIRDAGELCRELGALLHTHLAEDAADVEDARARGYEGPLERLHALGALVPGSILAHGVHLSESQVATAAALGCWIVQNPRSNRGNRVGYPHALKASGRVALGTDGYPSDMSQELQALFEIGSEHHENPAALGARLLGSETLASEVLGVRFPLRSDDAAEKPLGFAWTTRDACTARLIVDGRVVVEHGRLRTADIEAIRAEAREEAARLWHRMSEVAP